MDYLAHSFATDSIVQNIPSKNIFLPADYARWLTNNATDQRFYSALGSNTRSQFKPSLLSRT